MSHRRSTTSLADRLDPAAVGAVATSIGLVVVGITLPVVAGTIGGFVADAGSLTSAIPLGRVAMESPLLGVYDRAWLLHVSTLGLLGGCWLLGAGLVLDGLFD